MKIRFLFIFLCLILIGEVIVISTILHRLSNKQSISAPQGNNPVERENMQVGSTDWGIDAGHLATTQIQAFAGATSVSPGAAISFYASTQNPGTHYTIDFYRLGWYQGMGGRLLKSVFDQVGVAQGYYDAKNQQLTCHSCITDPQTGLLETHWQPSYTLQVPSDWVTGIYLAKFTDDHYWQTYAPFTVRGNSSSAYVVVMPDTTAAAYNNWGGSSLYDADEQERDTGAPVTQGAGVAAVSFNKPYIEGAGSGLTLLYTIQTIRWLEQQGYDLSYLSDVDLHVHPEQILRHKAYISLGHDEYWTKEMRDGIEDARDHGVGLAFLGANTAYWQMRFAPDSAGVPNRTVICYKVDNKKGEADLRRDPLYHKGGDNSRVTAQWRDPVLHRPENSLTGVMFSDFSHKVPGFAWKVDPHAKSPLLQNTGLQAGNQYSCAVVGYEWDRVFDQPSDDPSYRAATPKGLQVLSSSKVTVSEDGITDGVTESSNSAYYVADSGALVFASGSIYWGQALDGYIAPFQTATLAQLQQLCGNDWARARVVPGIQKLMANVLAALVIKHPAGHL